MQKKLLTLTEKAVMQAKKLIKEAPQPVKGLRISVKKTGCAGMSYDVNYMFSYEETKNQQEENPNIKKHIIVEDKGILLFVDPFASVFLTGAIIDYKQGTLESGFVFDNPNAKQSCGCGESFTV